VFQGLAVPAFLNAAFGNYNVLFSGVANGSNALGRMRIRLGGTDRAIDGTEIYNALVASGDSSLAIATTPATMPASASFIKITFEPSGAGQSNSVRDWWLSFKGRP
jgi:hypothetical protein